MACSTFSGPITSLSTLYGTSANSAVLYGTSYYTSLAYITTTSVSGGYSQRRQRRQLQVHDFDPLFVVNAPMPTAAPVVERDLGELMERDIEKRPYVFIYCSVCASYATYTCQNAAYPYISSCNFNTVGECAANTAWSYGGMVGNYAYGVEVCRIGLLVTITSSVVSSSIFATQTIASSTRYPTGTQTIVTTGPTSTSCPAGVTPVPVTTSTSSTRTGGSSTSSSTTPVPAPTGSSGLSTGAKAGIGAGSAIGALALIGLAGFFIAKNRKKTDPAYGGNTTDPYAGAPGGAGNAAGLGTAAAAAGAGAAGASAGEQNGGYHHQNGGYTGAPEFSGANGPSPPQGGYGGHDSYAAFGNGAMGHSGAGGGFSVDPAMAAVGTGATLGAAGAYAAGHGQNHQQYTQQYGDPYAQQQQTFNRGGPETASFTSGGTGSAPGFNTSNGEGPRRESVMSGLSNQSPGTPAPTTGQQSPQQSPTVGTNNSGNFASLNESLQVRDGQKDPLWDD
ncbi:hypothetical protein T439DRAFT_330343 [Meredithblackwellia eburnea MCA 4105]